MIEIQKFEEADWVKVWSILDPVFRAGETYPFSPGITEAAAHEAWIESPRETWVAGGTAGEILGTYFIKANQPGLGSHVCNCGYVVATEARGKGVATAMCLHSQELAIDLGFSAMQYNLVVSTNSEAIRLWKKLGFHVVGILPKAFNSKSKGIVDALVMYKELGSEGTE